MKRSVSIWRIQKQIPRFARDDNAFSELAGQALAAGFGGEGDQQQPESEGN
jgi:hypothetical protein